MIHELPCAGKYRGSYNITLADPYLPSGWDKRFVCKSAIYSAARSTHAIIYQAELGTNQSWVATARG